MPDESPDRQPTGKTHRVELHAAVSSTASLGFKARNSAGKLLVKQTEKVERFARRGRDEVKTVFHDLRTHFYRQSWRHPGTGEEHVKEGDIRDPAIHGKASSKRIVKRQPPTNG